MARIRFKTDTELFSFLYCKGINKKDFKTDNQVLCEAVRRGIGPAIEYILTHKKEEINIDMIECALESLPVHIIISLLYTSLKNGNEIDKEDVAIICFRNHKQVELIDKLIYYLFNEYGVDPNGKEGMVFTEACHYGCLDAVKYMIEKYKVDPNINDHMGFIFACRFYNYDIAKYLVENGADYKAKNNLAYKILQRDIRVNKTKQWLLELWGDEA